MSNVRVTITTKDNAVAVGTPDEAFVFSLVSSDGSVNTSQTSSDVSVVFVDVPPGDYTATVVKMGVSASGSVTVPVPAPTTVVFQVPSTVSVTVE